MIWVLRFSSETRSLLVLPFFFVLACQTGPRVQPTSEQSAWMTSAGLQARRSAAGAVSNLKMYPGLEATLFASEPRIVNPINLDVDDRGRVWVIEVLNYREHGRNDSRPEGDRILILEDLDADGVADTSKVYCQGRDIDAALGIAIVGNLVIDQAGNSVVARFVGERFPKLRGKESPYQGGMVFRCNLDGSDFEVLGHNFRMGNTLTTVGRHIAGQIVRSATSVAPNYGEAQSAESRRDFIHKMKVCLKELRETQGRIIP